MKPYSLTIDSGTGVVTTPLVRAILGTLLQIKATFTADGETIELAEGTTGRLVVKPEKALDGDPGMFDGTWVYGTGTYLLSSLADSQLLRDVLGTKATVCLMGQIEWQLPSEDEPRKCVPFQIEMINSVSRPGDSAPNPIADSTWEWIKETLVEGDNVTFTLDEENRTITISGDAGAHTHEIEDINDLQEALDGKAPLSHTHAISNVIGLQTELDTKATTTALDSEASTRAAADSALTTALGDKADLVDGKVPTSQIPAIAISTFLGTAANEAAMLALVDSEGHPPQPGDWCNRSDTSTAWVVIGDSPSALYSWGQINYPASPVTSVNGQTGVVVLGKSNVGLANVENTSDADKPVSTAQQSALNAKLASSNNLSDLADVATARRNLQMHATVVSGATALVSNRRYIVRPGTYTLTLPATPTDGDIIVLIQSAEAWVGVTVTLDRNGNNIDGVGGNVSFGPGSSGFGDGHALISYSTAAGWRCQRVLDQSQLALYNHTHSPSAIVGTGANQLFGTGATTAGQAITVSAPLTLSGGALDLNTSQALDDLSSTRGAVLYRGASGWAALAVGTAGQVLQTGGSGADPSWIWPKVEFTMALGDETTAATTGTKLTFRMPHAMTLTEVRLSATTGPTGAAAIIDVKEAGTTVFSTKPQIAAGAKTSVGGAVPGVISDSTLADDAEITVLIDQVGSTVAGAGYKVTLVGRRAA